MNSGPKQSTGPSSTGGRPADSTAGSQHMSHAVDRARRLRHELRTPVAHILGYSELLEEEVAEHDQPALLVEVRRIHGLGEQLLREVDALFQAEPEAATARRWRAFKRRCRRSLSALRESCRQLQDAASTLSQTNLSSDIGNIEAACEAMLALLDAPQSSNLKPAG